MKDPELSVPAKAVDRWGYIAGFAAYLVWGFLPIYWKGLSTVSVVEVLAWRMVGVGVLAWIAVLLGGRPLPSVIRSSRVIATLILASLLIAANWSTYIVAVATDRVIEASLGYYINPLINVTLGVVFLKEPLGRMRIIAVVLGVVAVVLMTIASGTLPWISLLIASLFAFYGFVKKWLPMELRAVEVLALESALYAPVAVIYLAILAFRGMTPIFGGDPQITLLLLGAGLVSLIPLWLFGIGAKRIPLGTLGFLQYVAPTIMLLLGIFAYGEPFGRLRAVAFGFVAAALTFYSWPRRPSSLRRRNRLAAEKSPE